MSKLKNILIVLLISLFPSLVFASTGHDGAKHHAPGIDTLFWPALNFVLYLALMNYSYRKLGKPALLGRSLSVKEQIERAEMALAQAQQDLVEVQSRDIDFEKQELFDKILADGKFLAGTILEDAGNNTLKIGRDVELRIAREFTKVEGELKTSVVKRASDLARREFESNLSESQDRELRKDALRSVLN